MLVYDGDCGFCSAAARWIGRRLPAGVPVVDGTATDLDAVGLTPDDVAAAAWWLDDDGTRLRGHRAVARALVAAGGAWAVVGHLLAVPPLSWAAAAVYALVARHRHRLPGAASCPPRPRRPE